MHIVDVYRSFAKQDDNAHLQKYSPTESCGLRFHLPVLIEFDGIHIVLVRGVDKTKNAPISCRGGGAPDISVSLFLD